MIVTRLTSALGGGENLTIQKTYITGPNLVRCSYDSNRTDERVGIVRKVGQRKKSKPYCKKMTHAFLRFVRVVRVVRFFSGLAPERRSLADATQGA